MCFIFFNKVVKSRHCISMNSRHFLIWLWSVALKWFLITSSLLTLIEQHWSRYSCILMVVRWCVSMFTLIPLECIHCFLVWFLLFLSTWRRKLELKNRNMDKEVILLIKILLYMVIIHMIIIIPAQNRNTLLEKIHQWKWEKVFFSVLPFKFVRWAREESAEDNSSGVS